jgi:hypothetical protein
VKAVGLREETGTQQQVGTLMPQHATPTSFQPGRSGNPTGRGKGSRNVVPAVRDLMLAVVRGEQATAQRSLVRAIRSPRHVIAFLDLAARLNREVGPHGDQGPGLVQIRINTSVPLDQLGPQPQELPDGAQGPEAAG